MKISRKTLDNFGINRLKKNKPINIIVAGIVFEEKGDILNLTKINPNLNRLNNTKDREEAIAAPIIPPNGPSIGMKI